MHPKKFILGLLAPLVLAPLSADAGVRVTFVHPEKYHDEDFRRSYKRDSAVAEFRKYFDKLGALYLKKN